MKSFEPAESQPEKSPFTQALRAGKQGLSCRRAISVTFATFAFAALILAAPASQAQTYSVIYNFTGGATDGAFPTGALLQDSSGNIYGVTSRGGAFDAGTIFKLDHSGTETVLYAFTGGTDGALPLSGLFRDPDGALYGTTSQAGDADCQCGTIFRLDAGNTLTTLHTFTGHDGNGSPGWSNRLISVNGELNGVTSRGGTGCGKDGCGVVFKTSKNGAYHVIYRFTGGSDGSYPISLVQDSAGHVYGNTLTTIFKIDTAGTLSTLYTFTAAAKGNELIGRLIVDADDNIHGVTYFGGNTSLCTDFGQGGCGVVFHVTPAGVETVIHKFFGGSTGALPFAGVLDVGGSLYGTTSEGGLATHCVSGCGMLFQIGKTGTYTVLHRFNSTPESDGAYPEGELLLGSDASIYGATSGGGTGSCSGPSGGCGVIFKYTP